MAIILYNLYIFVWIHHLWSFLHNLYIFAQTQHGCLANTVLALDPSNSVIRAKNKRGLNH